MSQGKGISRRSFLQKGAGASLGAIGFPYFVPASALGKDGRESPSNRLVAGIIGIGSQGTGNMKGFLHYNKYCQVVALDILTSSGSQCSVRFKPDIPVSCGNKTLFYVG